jgi:hypothetical protein
VDGREAEGVRAKLSMIRWSWQRVAARCGATPVAGCGGEAVREVHLTPALFEEARVGQGAHRRRHVLKEWRRRQYSTSMGKSEVTTSSVGIEGRGARGE